MTFNNPDIVDLTYDKLNGISGITAVASVMKNMTRKSISNITIATRTPSKNFWVLINKYGSSQWSWNTGGVSAQCRAQVKIEIIGRTMEGGTDAQDTVASLAGLVRQTIFQANFDGTGILDKYEAGDRNPSQPMQSLAVEHVIYEYLVSIGG